MLDNSVWSDLYKYTLYSSVYVYLVWSGRDRQLKKKSQPVKELQHQTYLHKVRYSTELIFASCVEWHCGSQEKIIEKQAEKSQRHLEVVAREVTQGSVWIPLNKHEQQSLYCCCVRIDVSVNKKRNTKHKETVSKTKLPRKGLIKENTLGVGWQSNIIICLCLYHWSKVHVDLI